MRAVVIPRMALLFHTALVAAELPPLEAVRLLTGFRAPVHVTHAGDGRLYIVEKGGAIRTVKSGAVESEVFLDIQNRVSRGDEQGLLSVAFPPGYTAKRYFYVNYTNLKGDTTISRFRLRDGAQTADPASETIVLTIAQPYENHNGGQIAFSPKDGYLYIGMGDGGGYGDTDRNGQNTLSMLGKMLRIDVEGGAGPYGIPADNPFAGVPGYEPAIWALGLRNPWRFSFDRETGGLYIGDVGQDLYEEIDFQPASSAGGENYGWNIAEALHCYADPFCGNHTGFTSPVVEYDHDEGCSVTGGNVYRGSRFPGLAGIYFFSDYCTGRLWGLRRDGDTWVRQLYFATGLPIVSFGEDDGGELYFVTLEGGLYGLEAAK